MSAVKIRLHPSELSREMGAMRVWLDHQRFEPSGFSCRDGDDGLHVCLEFKRPEEAQAFAERFGGRAIGPSLEYETLAPAASPPGIIS